MPEQRLASRRRRSLKNLMEEFAEEAQSRIDIDLLMLESGIQREMAGPMQSPGLAKFSASMKSSADTSARIWLMMTMVMGH